MKLEFRTLRADEIELRVGSVSEKGASLLLYKDSRCDMSLLDEVVGPMNWKREHSRENANCMVSIWDDEKKQWVGKEDTGTQSYTEAEKGIASDSFKRACVNWGIGRELYSAPFIWVRCQTRRKDNGRGYELEDRFLFNDCKVSHIAYDENRRITEIIISDKDGREVFRDPINVVPQQTEQQMLEEIAQASQEESERSWEELSPSEQVAETLRGLDPESREEMLQPVDERAAKGLIDYAKKLKVPIQRIIGAYGRSTVSELNKAEYGNAVNRLSEYSDRRNNRKVAKGV